MKMAKQPLTARQLAFNEAKCLAQTLRRTVYVAHDGLRFAISFTEPSKYLKKFKPTSN